MLDALKPDFQADGNLNELLTALRNHQIAARKNEPTEDIIPNLDKDLILSATFHLQESLLTQLDVATPMQLGRAFYMDLKTFMNLCAAIDEEEVAFAILQRAVDLHLDFFDKIKEREFRPFHGEIIESIRVIIDKFNLQFPQNAKANEFLAEAEYLSAKFFQWQTKKRLRERANPIERINDIIESVNKRYEDAMYSAKVSGWLKKEGPIKVEDPEENRFWETIATDFAQWLIDTGDEKAAYVICNEVALENPNTDIAHKLRMSRLAVNEVIYGASDLEDLSHLPKEKAMSVAERIKAKYPAFADTKLKN